MKAGVSGVEIELSDRLDHGVYQAVEALLVRGQDLAESGYAELSKALSGAWDRFTGGNFVRLVDRLRDRLTGSDQPIALPPPRVFLPVLREAMQEDDPRLSEMWISLLSTAILGSPNDSAQARRFSRILANLTPLGCLVLEALWNDFLNHLTYQQNTEGKSSLLQALDGLACRIEEDGKYSGYRFHELQDEVECSFDELYLVASDLAGLGLARWRGRLPMSEHRERAEPMAFLAFTLLGIRFTQACRPDIDDEPIEEFLRRQRPGRPSAESGEADG